MTLSTRRHGSATRERPGSEVGWHLMMITGLSLHVCGALHCMGDRAAWGSHLRLCARATARVQCAHPTANSEHLNPLPAPGIVVGAVHGRRGTRAAARGAPGAAW